MCLIAFNWQPERSALSVWANRDEFYHRPAQSTQFWPEAPHILAGRDLLKHGAWMGVTRSGRFAAVTNFREGLPRAALKSRGELVSAFLQQQGSAADYAAKTAAEAHCYGGFNLLVCDGISLYCVDDTGHAMAVPPGWHGLSNARLNTPWPKVSRLLSLVAMAETEVHGLQALQDTQRPDDAQLPGTGVGLDMERLLAAIYIESPHYGTRNSTVLRLTADAVHWHEREHQAGLNHAFSFAREGLA